VVNQQQYLPTDEMGAIFIYADISDRTLLPNTREDLLPGDKRYFQFSKRAVIRSF
jgi:hypothetical protein